MEADGGTCWDGVSELRHVAISLVTHPKKVTVLETMGYPDAVQRAVSVNKLMQGTPTSRRPAFRDQKDFDSGQLQLKPFFLWHTIRQPVHPVANCLDVNLKEDRVHDVA